MTVPLPLLLALLLAVSFSSCSKPNLDDIVKEHIKAVNNDDIKKNLTFFADDIVFEIFDDVKLSGKDQLRGLMESDVVNKARLTINDMKVKGDTVIVDLKEKNEGYRLLGIEEDSFKAIYEFRGRLLKKVKLEGIPESAKLYEEKYKPFAEWVSKEHPEEFKKQETGGYTAENCMLYLSLLKEWRDKTSAVNVSAEQELIRLENEWADAWVKSDVAFFERIGADDYTWTAPWGEVWTKARDLALLKSGDSVITSWVLSEMKVRVYGDAAVVTGRCAVKEAYKGKDVSDQYRFTDTWVKRAGRWQCVAGHSSVIRQK
jgi:ketosteroid isomerase-like protein